MNLPDLIDQRRRLQYLRGAALIEGVTLLLLLFAAMPLKYWAGMAIATRVMGPIHGVAFLSFSWLLLHTTSAEGWARSEALPTLLLAVVPFGGFVTERRLARRQTSLSRSLARY